MSEIAKLLRLMSQADKEFKITTVTTYGSPAKFTSQLTLGFARKGFAAYNNSATNSGEIAWGGSDCNVNGMPIPKGAIVDIPIASSANADVTNADVDVYFCNDTSGEYGDLRVIELS